MIDRISLFFQYFCTRCEKPKGKCDYWTANGGQIRKCMENLNGK